LRSIETRFVDRDGVKKKRWGVVKDEMTVPVVEKRKGGANWTQRATTVAAAKKMTRKGRESGADWIHQVTTVAAAKKRREGGVHWTDDSDDDGSCR